MRLKKKPASGTVKKSKMEALKNRLQGFTITAAFAGRMRAVLFVAAFILLFLAFQVGDDWFVREFANYDWARSIGF
ncbi:MAG: hypothetical protein KAJ51_16950 [Thermoplasmata archaeon]|nr:hypothetical protein [Thermoplasmata archaeon]